MLDYLMSVSQPLQKALTLNYATNGFPALVGTLTEPTGSGVFGAGLSGAGVEAVGAESQQAVFAQPYGTGVDGNTLSMRLTGWHVFAGVRDGTVKPIWIPFHICEVACTISTTNTGATGGPVLLTEYFAKTITITTGPTTAGVSVEVVSPAAAGLYGSVLADIKGAQKIQFTFSTGGVATDCNALWKFAPAVNR